MSYSIINGTLNLTNASGFTTTIQPNSTANVTLNIPPTSGNIPSTTSTDTLTNKTITDSSNTVTATQLRTTGADVVISSSSVPSSGQALIASNSTSANWQNIPAGGSNNQVQYNNNGILSATNQVTIAADGYAIFNDESGPAPTAPTTGSKVYAKFRAGRRMMAQTGPSGIEYSFQPFLATNKISWWTSQGNGTSVSTINFGNTTTGTATTRNVASTSLFTSMRRIGYVSSSTAGNSAGTRHGAQQFWRGNAAGLGGFLYVARFGLSSAATVNTQRSFVGLIASTSVIGNTDPSAITNTALLGFSVDSADTTWFFIHANGTNAVVKDSLTGTFPPRDQSTTMYEARIFCPPNGNTISYSLEVLNGGSLYEGSTSTNIPSSLTFLSPQIWTNNGTTASAVGIDVVSQYIETDN